jgi:hypothetical protein
MDADARANIVAMLSGCGPGGSLEPFNFRGGKDIRNGPDFRGLTIFNHCQSRPRTNFQ